MAVQGLVCGDCGQVVGVVNVAAAGQQYVCKQCRVRRERAFWRAAQGKRAGTKGVQSLRAVQVDLRDVIRQAAKQVFGGDERALLQDWLRRATDPQIVTLNLQDAREREVPLFLQVGNGRWINASQIADVDAAYDEAPGCILLDGITRMALCGEEADAFLSWLMDHDWDIRDDGEPPEKDTTTEAA